MAGLPFDDLGVLVDGKDLDIEIAQALDGPRHIDVVQRAAVEYLVARDKVDRFVLAHVITRSSEMWPCMAGVIAPLHPATLRQRARVPEFTLHTGEYLFPCRRLRFARTVPVWEVAPKPGFPQQAGSRVAS